MGALARDEDPGVPLAAVNGAIYRCRVRTILSLVDPDDAAAIVRRLADVTNTNRGLALWLRRYGHVVSSSTITNHRAGLCSCALLPKEPHGQAR